MSKVIEIENLSKVYDLGLIGTGTLSKDLNRTWAKLRSKPDPYATLVQLNDRTQKSSSNMVYALKDINFSVEKGDVLGIIGKNGAGKSTLLKILSQITSPSSGTIKIKGRVASLLEVGTGMHPEMTARQNIYLNGSLMGMRRHEITSKLDEIVDFAGIVKYLDTPIKRFSSGMTVRLGFAIAAFLEPEILIVDEVLAVGDAEFQKKAIGKMQDVSKGEGRTVLFVSHNLVSVKKLCTKGIVLHNGLIDHEGSCDNAVNYYSNLTVKSASKPVRERKDRIGNQKMTIVDIYAENVDGDRLQELCSGESYFLKLDYQKKRLVDPKQLTIVLQFKNDKGEVVNTIATDELGTVFSKIGEIGSIQIQFPKLQFREGNYSMNFLISEKLATNLPHEIMDFVEDAYLLKVIKGDYWKSGFINRPGGFVQEAEINIT